MTREERRQRQRWKRHKARELKEIAKGPIDLPFLVLVLMLTVIGLIMLFSASFPSALKEHSDPFYFARSQAIFAAAGIAAMAAMSKFNYQRLRGFSTVALIGSMVLLALVLTPLGVTRNHATRWLKMFLVAGPQYQPSELAKLGVIIYFANTISLRKDKMRTLWQGFAPYFIILVFYAALLLPEPHLSGCILIWGIGAVMMVVGGIHWLWIAAGVGVAGGGLYAMLFTDIMEKIAYNSDRIQTWRDPWWDIGDKSYQMAQSLISIGSGGLLGVGLGRSRQKFLFLPEEHNDYIFAIVCEELGMVGAIVIMALFALLIIRGYWLALHARDRFGTLLVVGITSLLAFQTFFNIGVVTGFLPPTGISLPFFSYGGTALAIQLAEMGMVLSVSRQIAAPKAE